MHKMLVLTAALASLAGSGCCLCRDQNACNYAPAPVACDECQSGGVTSGPEAYGPAQYGPGPITVTPGPG